MKLFKANKDKKNAGFSLIEIIAVVAVMAVLAAIAVPIYGQYTENAAIAADNTYVNEVYRAAAVVTAEAGDDLQAVAFTANGEIMVSHVDADEATTITDAATDADKITQVKEYKFCGGCTKHIAPIIGGMQDFQSKELSNATPTEGTQFDTPLGTMIWADAASITVAGNPSTVGAWILEVKGQSDDFYK